MSIQENLKFIRSKINSAEIENNRESGSVKLLAVSKFHTVEEIEEAINCGQTLFGENRVQEATEKFSEIFKKHLGIKLYIIGQLQTNKVKKAVEIASRIESVDSIHLLKEIEKQCEKINKKIEVLFELHTAEDSKSGFLTKNDVENAFNFIIENNFSFVEVKGFMTMAPLTDDENAIKRSFQIAREFRDEFQAKFPQFDLGELSMGMTNDYKIAISEGSTEVRIGTAIFGERQLSS